MNDIRKIGRSRTLDGAIIDLFYQEDIEGENRIFVVDITTAFIDGEKVGYLKHTHVPAAAYRAYNPSIWNHAQNFTGWCILPFDLKSTHPRDLRGETLKKFLSGAANHLHIRGTDVPKSLAELNQAAAASRGFHEIVRDVKRFRAHHIDRPYVDYISTRANRHQGLDHDNSRRGIATVLYIATARELHGRGLPFYASTLQQPEARAIWEKFTAAGLIRKVRHNGKTRLRLIPHRLPELSEEHPVLLGKTPKAPVRTMPGEAA